MKTPNAEGILEYFKDWDLDDVSRQYLMMHRYRYQFLLDFVSRLISEIKNEPVKILDIGESYQTEILRRLYPKAVVNTLGFGDMRFPPRSQDTQFTFDLNNTQYREKWIKTEKHDVIIMAEVLEHLYTSPLHVLRFLLTCLKDGGFLVIQTPNACKLENRFDMMFCKNPYELIREDSTNPGHFREYTLKELLTFGHQLGLKSSNYVISNYFDTFSRKSKIFNMISKFFPGNFRDGITISFQKNSHLNDVNIIEENVIGIQRSGFYSLENVNDELAVWTNGNASIIIPIEDCSPHRLTIDIFEGMGMNFKLIVNGVELDNISLPYGKWSNTYNLASLAFQDCIEIGLISGTFVPAKSHAASTDYRTLGIMVQKISLHEPPKSEQSQ